MIKIKDFYLEESKINKGCIVLIAVDVDGQKWVCSDRYNPTYLEKYETAFDTKLNVKPQSIK